MRVNAYVRARAHAGVHSYTESSLWSSLLNIHHLPRFSVIVVFRAHVLWTVLSAGWSFAPPAVEHVDSTVREITNFTATPARW